MAVKSQSEIITNIQTELADNNAGLISAYDVRHNMEDLAESVNYIVGSGNFDSTTPFTGSNVRAKITGNQYGKFVAESGILFPNAGGGSEAANTQYVPYPGPANIDHNDLANLTTGDPHTQYVNIDGSHKMTNNLALGTSWVNSSGNTNSLVSSDDRGIKFSYAGTTSELMHVGDKTTINFDLDNSQMFSAKSVAQAWIKFEGTSGNIVVNSSYNISAINHIDNGYYKIFFNSGTFDNSNYIAVGNSNSTTGSGSPQDFDLNTVGVIERANNYLTFVVRNDNGEYVNARVNDLVVFGNASGVTANASPTITNL